MSPPPVLDAAEEEEVGLDLEGVSLTERCLEGGTKPK